MYILALDKYPNDPVAMKKYLRETYEKVMMNMKKYVVCREISILNSMTYIFEHIKNAVIDITASFCDEDNRIYIESKNWDDIKYRKKLFDVLIDLEYKPIMIWLFFHTNYYHLENIDQQRKNLMENIELFYKFYPKKLNYATINDIYNACSKSNPLFSISYQNRNNRVILENYSKLLRKICPDLNYNGVQANRPVNKKIRVCFFSEFLTIDSSVLRDRIGIITQLPKDKFEIYYMSFNTPNEIKGYVSKFLFNSMKNSYVQLSEDLVEARTHINRYNFDIIVYCEIGMVMRSIYLAHSRLAPVQVTTWGHSETSGISTMDYFVSSKYFEIDKSKAQNHYSEQLYLMNSLSTYYFPPSKLLLPPRHKFQTRDELKLDSNAHLYGCIQSSFKISEDFEKILTGILKMDPMGYILMSLGKPFCNSQIQRMQSKMGDADFKRLIWMPPMPIQNYLNIIKLVDVMLDPYPFGGCNTSFEAFDFNIPVVTMPTKYLNGRFTFGMYKKMGFVDLVADSPQNYIKLAVRCATDKKWCETIQEKINRNKILLFQEQEAVKEWSEFLEFTYYEKVIKATLPEQQQVDIKVDVPEKLSIEDELGDWKKTIQITPSFETAPSAEY
jgi:predicted O-linked N-acetylglucosamine transferase (SPINDLY family)